MHAGEQKSCVVHCSSYSLLKYLVRLYSLLLERGRQSCCLRARIVILTTVSRSPVIILAAQSCALSSLFRLVSASTGVDWDAKLQHTGLMREINVVRRVLTSAPQFRPDISLRTLSLSSCLNHLAFYRMFSACNLLI
ncbi:hypothetical protein TNCV_728881 [Trichonephila clavipes]|nr:hypothetical protein TNCV_728881 [Trichonephila clavipes]